MARASAPFDLVVVGGGVAAAAALLALGGRRLRLAVVGPERPADDLIGESLAPAAGKELLRLGVWEEFLAERHLPARSVFSSWGSRFLEEREAGGGAAGAGWHLDRPRFERFLWRRAGDHRRFRARVIDVEAGAGGGPVALELSDGGALEAARVLDASGRTAAIGRRLGRRLKDDRLVAAYVFLDPVGRDIEATPGTLIEALPGGWFYSALLPDGRLVVAWFSDSDLLPVDLARSAPVWRRLVDDSFYTAKRIATAGYRLVGPPAITDASSQRSRPLFGAGWAAAGDAAAAFDPLSSHGIASALWSGRRAALALLEDDDGAALRRYARVWREALAQYRLDRLRIYAAERRFRDRPFWRRRRQRRESSEVRDIMYG